VAKVDGVRQVLDQITVLPVSQFDDQLRHRIARAIYRNPNFWNYATMADPPGPYRCGKQPGHVDRCGAERGRADAGSFESPPASSA